MIGFQDEHGNAVYPDEVARATTWPPNRETPDYFGDVSPELLWRAVRMLPQRQRFVVRSVVIEELSQADVAALMGVSQQAVSRIYSRALLTLHSILT